MQAYDENMGYKVEFTFDFGRGVPEQCRYYPEVKELHVVAKGDNNATRLIKMNPDIMAKNPSDDMRFIWDAARLHIAWLDADHAGEELDPKDAPPGIIDSDIALPPGMQPSIDGQENRTREVGVPPEPDINSIPTDDPDFDPPEGQAQGSPPPQARPKQDRETFSEQIPAAMPAPMIQIPLQMYIANETLIEMLTLSCETLTEILKRTVEPDSVDMALVDLHERKVKEYKDKRDGTED